MIHKYISRSIKSTQRFDQNIFDPRPIYGRQGVIFDQKTDYRLFGPHINVPRSSETPECNEINKKATRDFELTSISDQNHLENVLLCTEPSF